MAEAKKEGTIARKQDEGGEAKVRPSALRWVIGWILVPSLVIFAIFGFGLHIGANNPEAWYARAVMWIAELFA
jgi:hypothetical protein